MRKQFTGQLMTTLQFPNLFTERIRPNLGILNSYVLIRNLDLNIGSITGGKVGETSYNPTSDLNLYIIRLLQY